MVKNITGILIAILLLFIVCGAILWRHEIFGFHHDPEPLKTIPPKDTIQVKTQAEKQSPSSPPKAREANSASTAIFSPTLPPIGYNQLLSASEIAWVLKEKIRLDTLKDHIETNDGIDKLNELIYEFKGRAAKFNYEKKDFTRAKRYIKKHKDSIIQEAIRDAAKMDSQSKPVTPPAG